MKTNSNIEHQRFNMVEQQVRPWDVLDQNVLNVLASTPREDYVPDAYRNIAYVDMNIPLGNGREIMAPKLEGRCLQALEIKKTDSILEIGAGLGHLSSLLSKLGKSVYVVEPDDDLRADASRRLQDHGIANVTLAMGDVHEGWDQNKPYDVMLINGSVPCLPDIYREALAVGGRLLAIVGTAPIMEMKLITRVSEYGWTEKSLVETYVAKLGEPVTMERFQF